MSHLLADEAGILVKKVDVILRMKLLARDEVAYLLALAFHNFPQNDWF